MGFVDSAPPIPAGNRQLLNAKAPSSGPGFNVQRSNTATESVMRDLPTDWNHGPTPQAFQDYKGIQKQHTMRDEAGALPSSVPSQAQSDTATKGCLACVSVLRLKP